MKSIRSSLAAILLMSLVTTGCVATSQSVYGPVQAELIITPVASSGFAQVTGPQALDFPRDFGAHPEYQTEWWYYTGNLDTPDGRHFGYQLTFFRKALAAMGQVSPRESAWATTQAYLAHFAITDVAAQQFHSFERFERGAAGLAGAEITPDLKVWVDDWTAEAEPDGSTHLSAAKQGIALDLHLTSSKALVLEGDHGYSHKGQGIGNASIYFSQTRLSSSGTISVDGISLNVTGLSWMDHEFSTSALSHGDVGWDWFALQLTDGSEIMLYQLREQGGTYSPYSGGTYVDASGKAQPLNLDDYQITSLSSWISPHSGADYPASWRLEIGSLGISLQVSPYIPDQEHQLSYVYWEGAVRVDGSVNGLSVSGSGYVELTGYANSLHF